MASWAQRLSRVIVGILVASKGSRSLLRSTAWEVQEECRGHAVAGRAAPAWHFGGGTLCDECVRHGVDRHRVGRCGAGGRHCFASTSKL